MSWLCNINLIDEWIEIKINFRLTTDDIMFENRNRNKVTVGLFEKQIINIYI